jgi:uncharacterized protein (TIGR02594 family)
MRKIILSLGAIIVLIKLINSKQMAVYDFAKTFLGTKEISGNGSNPIIDAFLNVFGLSDDSTAWCSGFVGYVMHTMGYNIKGQGANARSWLKFGIETNKPTKGDIVVFWRVSPNSWQGHVAFLDRIEGNKIYCLGGNQSNEVNVRAYDKSSLLGFRTY